MAWFSSCRLDTVTPSLPFETQPFRVTTAGEEPRVPVHTRPRSRSTPPTGFPTRRQRRGRWAGRPRATRPGSRFTRLGAGLLGTAVAAALVVGVAAPAGAVPPPPDNPSDEQIQDSQQQAAASAAEVGRLAGLVTKTEGDIERLKDDMELKAELANKAAVDLQVAESDAAAAASASTQAQADADAAGQAIVDAKSKAAAFAAASFRQGSVLGSLSAFMGAGSASDLLQRQELLGQMSGSQLDAIGNLESSRTHKANLDSAAKAAFDAANAARARADEAKTAADAAQQQAQESLQNGQDQLATLQAQHDQQEADYGAALASVAGLQNQRDQYNQWLAQKQAEEEAARQAAAEAARLAAEEAARQAAAEAARQAAAAQAAAGRRPRTRPPRRRARRPREEEAAAERASAAQEASNQAARAAQEAQAAQTQRAVLRQRATTRGPPVAARSPGANPVTGPHWTRTTTASPARARRGRRRSLPPAHGPRAGLLRHLRRRQGGRSGSDRPRRARLPGGTGPERQRHRLRGYGAAGAVVIARPAAPATPASGVGQTVVDAAMAYLGTTYAWGGGDYSGPTLGIRDGGVADRYGDYNKVGFDCSGLALYAWAQVGVYLPHYSGYQYSGQPQGLPGATCSPVTWCSSPTTRPIPAPSTTWRSGSATTRSSRRRTPGPT